MNWDSDTSLSSASPPEVRTSASNDYPVTSIAGIVDQDQGSDGNPLFYSLAAGTGYSAGFFTALVPYFTEVVYPVNPIISPDEIITAISNMKQSFEDAALVYAFGAITTFLSQTSDTMSGGVSKQMDELMQYSLEAHKRADLNVGTNGRLIEESFVTMKRITTCVYLEVSMMAFKRFDRSFALLREAITMIQTIKVQSSAEEILGGAQFQRLYWEAFIHERFLTIASGYPSVLSPLKTGFPIHDPDIQPNIQLGFNRLISLFMVMDRAFLTYWVQEEEHEEFIPDLTIEWVERKQAQLDDDEASAARANQELQDTYQQSLTEFQHADLFITRLWLRTIVWQLALSRGLLRSGPLQNTHEGLSLHFPAQRLSKELRNLVTHLESVASISTQGSGIVQKLFEITSTISDVLALPLSSTQAVDNMTTQIEDFVFLVKFVLGFDRVRENQKQYLRDKIEALREQYPFVADYGLG